MKDGYDIHEKQSTFDFKGYLFSLLNHWPLFLISFVIAFATAYYINVRKLPIYLIENLVSIRDDQNPFFTTNTSLTFNWGGTTDKVNTSVITLKSRSHNEKVVDRGQFYLTYLREGKYQRLDAYKQTPFTVTVDTSQWQVLDIPIKIVFKDSVNFNLSVEFEDSGEVAFQNYSTKEKSFRYIEEATYTKDYKIGQKISEPFFSGTLMPDPEVISKAGTSYYLVFQDYNQTVASYLGVRVAPESRAASVLRMGLTGNNKAKLVDYLNASVQVLSDNMLERKNLFATKTIKFIDSSLAQKSVELSNVEDELNKFKHKHSIMDLEREGAEISAKLNELDVRREMVNRELDYYNILETYLTTRSDYSDVPAPSVAGISESSIVSAVGKIVNLAEERNKLQYSFKEDAPIFNDIDRQINAIKSVLLENIRSTNNLKNRELNSIQQDIAQYESDIRKLPKEQQDLLKIERRYNLSESTYSLFLSKRSEAGLVKAANVSDVMVIDPAKDTGGGKIGPNTQLNYVMAGLYGFFIPVFIVFARVFFDTKIRDIKQLEKITPIPVLGMVGKSKGDSNLAVLDSPKSAISEAFRNLRSSLQFLYKERGVVGSKTVLITSSISGEGKSFCAINLASVFALSDKKAVIVDLDLRKPKVSKYINIDNTVGVVDFLINEKTIDEIIKRSDYENLDIITSGRTPPNPSELLIGDRFKEMLDLLRDRYDYIVLDSPPIGLVTDSLDISKHVDATLYIARYNYTSKNMFAYINEKYRKGEIENISVVMNGHIGRGGYGYGYNYNYGYGSYSRYGYGYQGYHEADTPKSFWSKIKEKFTNK